MVCLLLSSLLLLILPGVSCLSQDEGSFSLSYNGGRIMSEPITVNLIWVGTVGTSWEKSGQDAIRNAISSLSPSPDNVKTSSEVPTLGEWWEVVSQYKDFADAPVTEKVDVGAECFYVGPKLDMTVDRLIGIVRSAFNQTSIDGLNGNLTCTQSFEVNESTIYHVVFSEGVLFSLEEGQGELTVLWCRGKLEVELLGGVKVNTVWARAPQQPSDQCSAFFRGKFYLGPPNGDEKIDSLVGYVMGNIAEAVTNGDGRGWSGNDGSDRTVSSSCGSVFQGDGGGGPPLFMDVERNVSFNAVGLNGYRYILQYVWDQKIKNCALKPSEAYANNLLTLKQPKGYLSVGIIANHTTGLQPYPPNQKHRWKIDCPAAKFISFTVNLLLFSADSNDQLKVCQSDSSYAQCSIFPSSAEKFDKSFKITGSNAYVEFTSGELVPFESRGWEITYSGGFCSGKKDVYNHKGVISYSSSPGYSYAEGLSCQWILHGKPGTLVTLNLTHINITKDFDFIAIYNPTTMRQITNFSGIYSSSDLPLLNLTGEVAIEFATQTDKGEGWSANFYINSPIDQEKKGLLIVIVIVLGGIAVGFSMALVTLAFHKSRKKRRMESIGNSVSMTAEVKGEETRIGEGFNSIVSRGVSTDGKPMAIKFPKQATFATRLEQAILLKTSSHPNVISLVGIAEDGIHGRKLVFEFMGGGNLSWNLRERGEIIGWEKRLEIAQQISSAIQMLHMYLKPPICHGNITGENVLLDENYNAKLGGFGAANYCLNDGGVNSEMTEDIWSFGLLLVELLTGEPNINRNACVFVQSFEVINEVLGGEEYLDPRLGIPREEWKIMGLAKLGEIAKWCIGGGQRVGRGENSPKIGDVVSGLKQVKLLFCSVPR